MIVQNGFSMLGMQSIQELMNEITYFNENKMMFEPHYIRQNQVIKNKQLSLFFEEQSQPSDTDIIYHSQNIVRQNQKKYQKNNSRITQHKEPQKKNSQYYIKILQPILRSQIIQNTPSNNSILPNYEQEDTQSILRDESKKKKIKKSKRKQLKHVLLSQELNIRKKHLSKLWSTKIKYFIRDQNTKKYNIPSQEIEYVKREMMKSSITIQQISSILMKKQWLREVILNEELLEDKPLEYIYNSNITSQSKLIMFETYDIFKQAVRNPEKFNTWDPQRRRKSQQSENFFYEKCKGKSLDSIIYLLNEEFKDQLDLYETNKCSKQNNISHCWFSYLKDVLYEQQFTQICNHHNYLKLKQILKMPASLKNIQNALQINQFSKYILNTKIKTEYIFKQIITNQQINILNKKNMLESFSCFHLAVDRPSTLKKWPKLHI